MRIHIRVYKNADLIKIEDALKSGEIVIEKNCINSLPSITICISTLLRDQNGYEIFENDILRDTDSRLFRVVYRNGAFFAEEQAENGINLPLYLLQWNGVIPAQII